MKTLFAFKDVEVLSDESLLVIRNSRISRTLDMVSGAPRTISLTDSLGHEFASPEKETPDIAFIGMHTSSSSDRIHWKVTDISASVVPGSYKDSEHVKVAITMEEPFSETRYLREYLIYPGFPAISVQNSISLQVQPQVFWTRRGHLDQTRFYTNQRESVADSIYCAEGYRPKQSVVFRGRTDCVNELVVETPIVNQEYVNGNLLFCGNEAGAGFFFAQEAPPSEERRDLEEYDFRICGNRIDSCCWGIHPSEAVRGACFTGYRHDLIVHASEDERLSLLKQFIRMRYPAKELSIMVNPWGCGRFREYISEQFIMEEMKASGEIGADFYQIDDEWQTGRALANLINFNRRVREDFWTISKEKFNGTFANVIRAANEAGVRPALWLAPSMNCEYEDWQTMGDQILDFHKQYGFANFKIDGVLIRSKKAEDNLRRLLEYVRDQTEGKVYFNLDTTNGQRPGYFLFLEYGNIFLENRYCHTFWDAPYNYHPERTLRNLWELSRYICPADLQIEVPSVSDIKPETYQEHPERRPDLYSQEYWAAIALFANPLIWTAPSRIGDEEKAVLTKMLALHKQYREQISRCEISPIGDRPCGAAVTGFLAWDREREKAFLLVFREQYSEQEQATLSLPYATASRWHVVAGEGRVIDAANGEVSVGIPQKQYLFAESES